MVLSNTSYNVYIGKYIGQTDGKDHWEFIQLLGVGEGTQEFDYADFSGDLSNYTFALLYYYNLMM